ncbi:MAG: URC4/urg3 family protein [Bdellovibrionales bacterium]
MNFTQKDIDYILSPRAVRESTKKIFQMALDGKTHFKVNLEKLGAVSDYVLSVIHDNYPDLKIPFHSRNGHLNAGGVNRTQQMVEKLGAVSALDAAKSKIDLIVVSVLLDAGAGDNWKYVESPEQKIFARSEGLAVASYHMFLAGGFSGDKNKPLQANSAGLKNLKPADLEKHFQISSSNPLIGVEGRIHLLNQLAVVIEKHPTIFKNGRIGDMLDVLLQENSKTLKAVKVLDFVLNYLGDIWPSRLRLGSVSLGDVWNYSGFGKPNSTEGLVAFHKLSQWLTYSLLVPIIEMGVTVEGVDELTGLAEYRNGGLFIDAGLIELRNSELLKKKHAPETDLVIEWRALTVSLLDLIGDKIREKLKMTKEELPLAKVLEGGTWHAGRKIAKEKRPGGEPPLNIISDGTVF